MVIYFPIPRKIGFFANNQFIDSKFYIGKYLYFINCGKGFGVEQFLHLIWII
ncbi:hypothetical protein PLA106_24548 [Pseudomonas amygdali pv. lachrymans str. M302278]|nr:hypothetical protein PLA106_24548 [Pseudomonas amygdali pv. lachrymans str. M302278]